ncbi:hypothetical protein PG991_011054 [Apiospora marii]|uniref:Uncharacterized protein n=1 Tax=Apiospora marii TaxID=335849 RepID=A0ABR1RD55_9PEZI
MHEKYGTEFLDIAEMQSLCIYRELTIMYQLAQRSCDKILRWKQVPIDVNEAYNCFAADTISQYAFGQPLGC